MGNKNLWADEVLGDNFVDSPNIGQTVRLDSPDNLSSKIEDLDPKLVFVKKMGKTTMSMLQLILLVKRVGMSLFRMCLMILVRLELLLEGQDY
ncbi:hypothetical protein TorRG33x02_119110 [Trema orientale]|uniref:Uncharacterized protein n=1 Tax=Trema orientale TaxID=63057 RepID=A0A2P5F3E4_TREOI|nr:hypothetical protein TorRG33x02_119110 [Trema orientale]